MGQRLREVRTMVKEETMEYRLLNNGEEVFTGSFDELIDHLDKGGEKVYDEIVDPYLNNTDWGEAQSIVDSAINRIDALSGASVDMSKLYDFIDDIPLQALEHMVEFGEFNDYSTNLKIEEVDSEE